MAVGDVGIDSLFDVVNQGHRWIVGFRFEVVPRTLSLELSTSRDGDVLAEVTFRGVRQLTIADLLSDWSWDLAVCDISAQGLEDLSISVTDPPMGRCSFYAKDCYVTVGPDIKRRTDNDGSIVSS
jgi:hypothetical protein